MSGRTVYEMRWRGQPNSSASATVVVSGDTLNSRTYRGDHGTAPAPQARNEVVLITSGGNPSKFQTSTGAAAYADATVEEALGTNGKFLGSITGAEPDSSNVNSSATAKTYFDTVPSRYVEGNTYYFFHSGQLRILHYGSLTDQDANQHLAVVRDTWELNYDDPGLPVTLVSVADQVPIGELQTHIHQNSVLIESGVAVLYANAAYTAAVNGQGVLTTAVKGQVKAVAKNIAAQGHGTIVGGGTRNVNGTDRNVYYVAGLLTN